MSECQLAITSSRCALQNCVSISFDTCNGINAHSKINQALLNHTNRYSYFGEALEKHHTEPVSVLRRPALAQCVIPPREDFPTMRHH